MLRNFNLKQTKADAVIVLANTSDGIMEKAALFGSVS